MAHLFGRQGILSRHRVQLWRQLATAYRDNPSRWHRYVSLHGMRAAILSFVRVLRERTGLVLKQL